MPVKVNVQQQISLLLGLFYQELCVVYSRVKFSGRLQPLPVKVCSCQIASVVSDYDSVNVQHRDDLKDEVVSQNLGQHAISKQKVYYVLDDVTYHSFSWMHPRGDDNSLFIFQIRSVLPYHKIVTVVTSF